MICILKLYEQIFLSLLIFYSIKICNNPYINGLTMKMFIARIVVHGINILVKLSHV